MHLLRGHLGMIVPQRAHSPHDPFNRFLVWHADYAPSFKYCQSVDDEKGRSSPNLTVFFSPLAILALCSWTPAEAALQSCAAQSPASLLLSQTSGRKRCVWSAICPTSVMIPSIMKPMADIVTSSNFAGMLAGHCLALL